MSSIDNFEQGEFSEFVDECERGKGRKRLLNKDEWKKTKQRLEKRNKLNNGCKVVCNHEGENFCSARTVSQHDLELFHKKYWGLQNAVKERQYIQRNIQVSPVAIHSSADPKRKCTLSTTYYIQTSQGPVRVCKMSFLSILSVGRSKVENAAKQIMKEDEDIAEKRGGRRDTDDDKRLNEEIVNHIKQFRCRESHYGRQNSPSMKYLPSHLSVSKMHKTFLEETNRSLKECLYSRYWKVFSTKFNLGFGSLKSDKCSECIRLKNLRSTEADIEKKKELILQYIIHNRRAQRFYNEMNLFSEETLSLNFDLMQNQPLPKTPIGEAYYARQLWYYTFGIVIHTKDKVLNHDTVFFYRWLESEYGRGCNEITSCLNHFLHKVLNDGHLNGIKKIRFFSDSCVGQNKNYTVLTALTRFCQSKNIQFEWVFPVKGHSYMPADRAFGLFDRKCRKVEEIIYPEQYDNILTEVGTLFKAPGVVFSDWKLVCDKYLRSEKGFKITEAKKLMLNDPSCNRVDFLATYSGVSTSHDIYKHPILLCRRIMLLKKLNRKNHATQAKMDDVKRLLTAMGHNWNTMDFYKNVFSCQTSENLAPESDDEDIAIVCEDIF